MGLADALKGRFARRRVTGQPFVLGTGEVEITRAVGTWRVAALTTVDGDLVLTTQRLVFAPIAGDVPAVLIWTLHGPGRGRAVAGPVNAPARRGEADPPPPPGIAAVEVGADASLTSPPTLVVVDAAGSRTELGILANRLIPNLSGANAVARDRAVAAIRMAIAGVWSDR